MLNANATICRETSSQIFIYARQTKVLIWGNVSRGACEQTDGQLALRSDGTGTWSCTTATQTPYGADVWHADFAVKDSKGTTLFGLGPFYSPLMKSEDAARPCAWSASFTFPAELFPTIHAAVQNCGCLPPAHALRQATPDQAFVDAGWCRAGIHALLEGAYA